MCKNNMVSVVIPTLQKNTFVLFKLLDTLIADNSVKEIIIIDNSCKGIDYKNEKIKVIIPEKNLYVNPSWNLGVKSAECEIVALFNDDLLVSENFCSDVINQITPDVGLVGFNSSDWMLGLESIEQKPENTNPIIEKTDYRDLYYGTIMFIHKDNYCPIPDEIKIVYGDDWLFYHSKKPNYKISNQDIFHLGSLSSADKHYNPICKNDAKIYKRLTVKWYNRLFSTQKVWNGTKLRLLGITLLFKNKNAKGVKNR